MLAMSIAIHCAASACRSRSRAKCVTSHRLFPTATLVAPESQLADYHASGGAAALQEVVTIPDEIRGISKVRNWILRRFDETAIVIGDDDINRPSAWSRHAARCCCPMRFSRCWRIPPTAQRAQARHLRLASTRGSALCGLSRWQASSRERESVGLSAGRQLLNT